MEHNHEHHHNSDHDHSHAGMHVHGLSKNLWVAFFLNFSFTIIEFIGGFYTNSMAILSDAIHDLGDTAAIGSALFLEKMSLKSSDNRYSYGYRRLSPLSAFITTSILISGSIVIIVEAIPRILEPQEVESEGMIYLAIVGVIVNGIAVLKLKNDSHAVNVRAVMLHLLEDVLGWIAVLLGALAIHFFGWYFLDGYLSLAIAGFILFNAFKNLKDLSRIFLQGVPQSCNIKDIETTLLKIDGVEGWHDLHLWTLDGQNHVLTVHLILAEMDAKLQSAVKETAKRKLHALNISHATIEIESKSQPCKLKG